MNKGHFESFLFFCCFFKETNTIFEHFANLGNEIATFIVGLKDPSKIFSVLKSLIEKTNDRYWVDIGLEFSTIQTHRQYFQTVERISSCLISSKSHFHPFSNEEILYLNSALEKTQVFDNTIVCPAFIWV